MRTIDESSSFRLAWDILILVLIVAGRLLNPFQLSFRHAALTSATSRSCSRSDARPR